jgi:hypothetical protein
MFSLAGELRTGEHMKVLNWIDRRRFATALLATVVVLKLLTLTMYAQNLGAQPATGQAVQGQTAAQPEGAVCAIRLNISSEMPTRRFYEYCLRYTPFSLSSHVFTED